MSRKRQKLIKMRQINANAELADAGANNLEAYYQRQIEWSGRTFGPGKRTRGIVEHIRKELDEVLAKPDDLSEWVDVVILAMDGFWRHGGTADGFMAALLAKQAKNFARKWPPPGPEDRAIEHVRDDNAGPRGGER